jgi:hypothetical protein
LTSIPSGWYSKLLLLSIQCWFPSTFFNKPSGWQTRHIWLEFGLIICDKGSFTADELFDHTVFLDDDICLNCYKISITIPVFSD